MSMGRMLRRKQNASRDSASFTSRMGPPRAENAMTMSADTDVVRELLLGLLDEVSQYIASAAKTCSV